MRFSSFVALAALAFSDTASSEEKRYIGSLAGRANALVNAENSVARRSLFSTAAITARQLTGAGGFTVGGGQPARQEGQNTGTAKTGPTKSGQSGGLTTGAARTNQTRSGQSGAGGLQAALAALQGARNISNAAGKGTGATGVGLNIGGLTLGGGGGLSVGGLTLGGTNGGLAINNGAKGEGQKGQQGQPVATQPAAGQQSAVPVAEAPAAAVPAAGEAATPATGKAGEAAGKGGKADLGKAVTESEQFSDNAGITLDKSGNAVNIGGNLGITKGSDGSTSVGGKSGINVIGAATASTASQGNAAPKKSGELGIPRANITIIPQGNTISGNGELGVAGSDITLIPAGSTTKPEPGLSINVPTVASGTQPIIAARKVGLTVTPVKPLEAQKLPGLPALPSVLPAAAAQTLPALPKAAPAAPATLKPQTVPDLPKVLAPLTG